MANSLYGKARQAFANGQINWSSDTIRAQLIDLGTYTVSIDVDEFLSDVPAGARIGAAALLTNKTNLLGVLDADDLVITGMTAAPTIEAILIYKDTGVATTSRLIAIIDTATGLPLVAGTNSANIIWSNGTNKILKL